MEYYDSKNNLDLYEYYALKLNKVLNNKDVIELLDKNGLNNNCTDINESCFENTCYQIIDNEYNNDYNGEEMNRPYLDNDISINFNRNNFKTKTISNFYPNSKNYNPENIYFNNNSKYKAKVNTDEQYKSEVDILNFKLSKITKNMEEDLEIQSNHIHKLISKKIEYRNSLSSKINIINIFRLI